MVQVVERITEIEAKNNLFSFRDKNGMPVWDVIRYDVIKHIQYHFNPNKETVPQKSLRKRIRLFFTCFKPYFHLLSVRPKRVLFYVDSRRLDDKGKFVDREAVDLINMVNEDERIVFDADKGKDYAYHNYELPIPFFYLKHRIRKAFIYNNQCLNTDDVKNICASINKSFDEDVICEGVIYAIYEKFIALCEMFDWILRKVKPERVFISYGRYKAISYAARKQGIPTWLIQHSLIDRKDGTIAGTCPKKEDGVNPDVLLTYGSYWGDYLKHLMEVQVLGNRFLYKDHKVLKDDGTILFISSIYQGPYLSKLAIKLAEKHPSIPIVYKLHSGETGLKERYEQQFVRLNNVNVILNEESIDSLLQRCSLVVLISSTTFFEALNMGKCVAIYDLEEFSDVTSFLKSAPNSYCFTELRTLEDIINSHKYVYQEGLTYYDDFQKNTAAKVIGLS